MCENLDFFSNFFLQDRDLYFYVFKILRVAFDRLYLTHLLTTFASLFL